MVGLPIRDFSFSPLLEIFSDGSPPLSKIIPKGRGRRKRHNPNLAKMVEIGHPLEKCDILELWQTNQLKLRQNQSPRKNRKKNQLRKIPSQISQFRPRNRNQQKKFQQLLRKLRLKFHQFLKHHRQQRNDQKLLNPSQKILLNYPNNPNLPKLKNNNR